MAGPPILDVRDLRIGFAAYGRTTQVLHGVDLRVEVFPVRLGEGMLEHRNLLHELLAGLRAVILGRHLREAGLHLGQGLLKAGLGQAPVLPSIGIRDVLALEQDLAPEHMRVRG